MTWWQITLVVLYLFIGLDNVLESRAYDLRSWGCWLSTAADFFLWPLQALRGIYNVAWIIRDVRKSARGVDAQRGSR